MNFCNEQRADFATSGFLQRSTSATSNEQILQRLANEWFFATSNEGIL